MELCRWLLDMGAQMRRPDSFGQTPLLYACRGGRDAHATPIAFGPTGLGS